MNPRPSMVWCEHAFIDGTSQPGVLLEITNGRFSSVTTGAPPGTATPLSGFTLPGFANAHSHAFHRALRSRTQAERGTFWTWRDLMYRAAARLEPDTYYRLARAVFGEMALTGVACVGEFHYVHHQIDGTPYQDPNEMGLALLAAADAAGIRITLLDTLYLHGGLDTHGYSPPEGTQRRFSDQSAERWVDRVDQLMPGPTHRVGSAIHSVRAVTPAEMCVIAEWAEPIGAPVHAHISEQPLENDACLAFHGATPIGVVADAGLVSDRFTAVHATHLDAAAIDTLSKAGATVAMCPTTERDLGDGIGPTSSFAAAGIPMALGSDSHAVIDMFEEARAIELHERLSGQKRGIHAAAELVAAATVNGHRSLGWHDAGSIAVGHRADLVTINLTSVRTAGGSGALGVETAMFAATASDISSVYVDGRCIVSGGTHVDVDVAADLGAAIFELMGDG